MSIDTQKSIWQKSTPFMIKTLNGVGIEGNFLNLPKGIEGEPQLLSH